MTTRTDEGQQDRHEAFQPPHELDGVADDRAKDGDCRACYGETHEGEQRHEQGQTNCLAQDLLLLTLCISLRALNALMSCEETQVSSTHHRRHEGVPAGDLLTVKSGMLRLRVCGEHNTAERLSLS